MKYCPVIPLAYTSKGHTLIPVLLAQPDFGLMHTSISIVFWFPMYYGVHIQVTRPACIHQKTIEIHIPSTHGEATRVWCTHVGQEIPIFSPAIARTSLICAPGGSLL